MNFDHYDYAGSRDGNRRGQCRQLTVSKEEETRHKLCKIRGATGKEKMCMLMRDKPTRYHSDNDTNNIKDIHSLLKLSACMLSSSTVVRPHPFEDSCVVASFGRVWVGGETGDGHTSISGSTSTTLTTAFPSRTRRILSASQVGVLALGDAPFDGNWVIKACKKVLPRC
jgi:hypothetical protein